MIFTLLKFRTFQITPGGALRLGPVGRLLQFTALDELPQLINVVRGDMSLVGPRAIRPLEPIQTAWWTSHSFAPGVTGLAQIEGIGLSIQGIYSAGCGRAWIGVRGVEEALLARAAGVAVREAGRLERVAWVRGVGVVLPQLGACSLRGGRSTPMTTRTPITMVAYPMPRAGPAWMTAGTTNASNAPAATMPTPINSSVRRVIRSIGAPSSGIAAVSMHPPRSAHQTSAAFWSVGPTTSGGLQQVNRPGFLEAQACPGFGGVGGGSTELGCWRQRACHSDALGRLAVSG
jgi:hypothetical protein